MKATGYMRYGIPSAALLSSPTLRAALARKQAADAAAAAKKAEAERPPVSPTGAVPPPPASPLDTYVPPTVRPRPELDVVPAIVPAPLAPGGGVGPISVTVSPGLVAPEAPAAAPRGFGMVEAAIAAGIAAVLGMALARKGRRR
jgi:hypothetical protein